ncbi:hypothetical protein [Rhodoferax antarcticus]|uniref:hypothetical protein n=1 Tax=Rhodoferax antarcticus TaxID=81479 RepID=UPI002224DF2B|nr:hypothetical protein [Rhodoferax antarcticus]MCW2313808.1 hypothetical protein [Rhodoferax antarcticus]
MKLSLIVTDSGPLITLAVAEALDVLFIRENPLAPFTAIMQKLVSRFGDGLGAGF